MLFEVSFIDLKLLFSNKLLSVYPIFPSNLVLSTLAYPKLIKYVYTGTIYTDTCDLSMKD